MTLPDSPCGLARQAISRGSAPDPAVAARGADASGLASSASLSPSASAPLSATPSTPRTAAPEPSAAGNYAEDFAPVGRPDETGLGISGPIGPSSNLPAAGTAPAPASGAPAPAPMGFDPELYAKLLLKSEAKKKDDAFWTMGSIVALIVLVMQLFYIILSR